jgi:phosphopantothenoylcysteine decarboxylase/phosphopantothenate--cysteine ligase
MTRNITKLKNKKILLGVSGGIAAYKAVDLASKLTAYKNVVKTVMTENACQLVTGKSFAAVTNSEVFTSMWTDASQYSIGHVKLVDWADVFIVAPATANIIGKAANGICDDLLSTILCVCWDKKVLLAPAMNNNMWQNPTVQNNVAKIKEIGFELIGPVEGRLACGTVGPGRMAEPTDIINALEKLVSDKS